MWESEWVDKSKKVWERGGVGTGKKDEKDNECTQLKKVENEWVVIAEKSEKVNE